MIDPFSKHWFLTHQKKILWFANTRFGRDILCINSRRSSLGENKILRILPNAIFWVSDYQKDKPVITAEFRTHDKFAKRLFYAAKPIWMAIHNWDMHFANQFAPSMNMGFDTTGNLFSDAGGDGAVLVTDSTWNAAHDATSGDTAEDSATAIRTRTVDNNDGTFTIYRGFYPFDTSSIDDGATIDSATFSMFGLSKVDGGGSIGFVQSQQASNTALVTGDFDQCGDAVDDPTEGASRIAISAYDTTDYNNITLNATGLTWVSDTGFTKLGTRTDDDITDTTPGTTADDVRCSSADETGTSQDPKLVVTFTPASAAQVIWWS